MELLKGKKGGSELLGMDGTYGREKGWNGTFRNGRNSREGRGGTDGWNLEKGGTGLLGMDGTLLEGKWVERNSYEDGGGPGEGTIRRI